MDNIITEKETETLLLSLGYSRRKSSFHKDEIQKIIEWAERVRIEAALLQGVLDYELLIDIDPEKGIVFEQTPKGIERAKDLIKNDPDAKAFWDRLVEIHSLDELYKRGDQDTT